MHPAITFPGNSINRCSLSSLVLTLALLINSSSASARDGDDAVLATIGNGSLTQSDFNRYIRSGWASASIDEIRTNRSARSAALEAFFDLQVMAARTRQQGIDKTPAFQKASQMMEMKLLVQAITDRDRAKLLELAKDPSGAGKQNYMAGVNAAVGLKLTGFATNDSPLLFTGLVASNAVLATLGGTPILESDFQWFLKDAFRPEQRPYVFGQPGARKRLLNDFLSMRALEAKARQDGLDREETYLDVRAVMEDKLLAEFLQERDHQMPWQLSGSDSEKTEALRKYLDKMRSETGLEIRSLSTNSIP